MCMLALHVLRSYETSVIPCACPYVWVLINRKAWGFRPDCCDTSNLCLVTLSCQFILPWGAIIASCDVIWRYNVIIWCHMTSRCHHVTSYVVKTSHTSPCLNIALLNGRKLNFYLTKIIFLGNVLYVWPLTLAIKLIQGIDQLHPDTKFCVRTSSRSAVRALTDGHTHTQTDLTDSITLTSDAGGKNQHLYQMNYKFTVEAILQESLLMRRCDS